MKVLKEGEMEKEKSKTIESGGFGSVTCEWVIFVSQACLDADSRPSQSYTTANSSGYPPPLHNPFLPLTLIIISTPRCGVRAYGLWLHV